MGSKFVHGITCLLFLVAIYAFKAKAANYDVKKFGAKGDDKTDDSTAFLKAWKKACSDQEESNYVIPDGNYRVGPLKFAGPCKARVNIEAKGHVRSLKKKHRTDGWWIGFESISGFSISGDGDFHGAGIEYNCNKSKECENPPANLYFKGVYNAHIKGIMSDMSRSFHFAIFDSNNVTVENVTINGKPGTDGIVIQGSTDINITDVEIDIEDTNKCVTIRDGSSGINIEKMVCAHGGGIGLGVFGRFEDEKPVMGVTVKNCTLLQTSGGIKIESYAGSQADLILSNLVFEDIEMDDVSNPIRINLEYCTKPPEHCRHSVASKVSLLNVSFKKIRGSTATPLVAEILCSNVTDSCKDVELSDIDLKYTGTDPNDKLKFECRNVKPIVSGKVSPPACVAPQ